MLAWRQGVEIDGHGGWFSGGHGLMPLEVCAFSQVFEQEEAPGDP